MFAEKFQTEKYTVNEELVGAAVVCELFENNCGAVAAPTLVTEEALIDTA